MDIKKAKDLFCGNVKLKKLKGREKKIKIEVNDKDNKEPKH